MRRNVFLTEVTPKVKMTELEKKEKRKIHQDLCKACGVRKRDEKVLNVVRR